MTMDVLTTVYIGNAMGIVLLLTLIFSNYGRMGEDLELKKVYRLLYFAISSCIADSLAFTVDGHPGMVNTVIIYIANSWLYVANMLISMCWVRFLANHVGVRFTKRRGIVYFSLFSVGILALVINPFIPIVFTVKDNVYQRTGLYSLYILIAGIFILDSVFIYMRARKKNGVLHFFPIYVFLVPVTLGVVVQSLFYGISVIWASVAVAIAGVMTALKNEVIFTDQMTGLYNRYYLEYLPAHYNRKGEVFLTGIMLDLNDFKSINDRFGHAAGDEVLVRTAEILRDTVGEKGCVIRYAGDEFVILLNLVDKEETLQIIREIQEAFESFNRLNGKPYVLSVSAGYAVMDLKKQNMNEFMNIIDTKMYESKSRYYRERGIDRRKS